MAKEKDTGLSAFTETQEIAVEERTTKANARTKATGKVIHAQLRLNHRQWGAGTSVRPRRGRESESTGHPRHQQTHGGKGPAGANKHITIGGC